MEQPRWSELFAGPPLERGVRAALAERIVRFTEKPLWLALFAGVTVVLLSAGWSEPTRLVPAAVIAVSLLRISVFRRRRQWLRAAAWLGSTILVAIASGVLLNSVHAPVYAGGLVLLAFVIPVFGAGWGLATGAALVGFGALWFILDSAGLSLGPLHPSAFARFVMYVFYVIFALFVHGGTQRLLGDALEAADRKQREAEEARRAEAASERAFHAVFYQASTGMVLLTAAGQIARLNHRAASWLGATEQALTGLSLDAASSWGDEQRKLLADAVAGAAAGRASQSELTISAPLGARQIYQLQFSPFHDRHGQVGHVLVEVIDLTEHVATRTMLSQARRLEALGKLSGGVAHDINNMLAAILGGSEVARAGRKAGDSQRVETGLSVIDSSVVRASSLTKQLLAFGRQDRFESANIDVKRLVLEMGRLFEHTLHKSIALELVVCDQPAVVRGDVAALENMLLNLALNAQDAMPDGGTLSIAVTKRDIDAQNGRELHGQIAHGPAIVLMVRDTGSGMSEQVRERMFEPFFTTKPLGKGTGLGLAAVHGTLRAHQGAIAVHSRVGLGSTIELLIPEIEGAVTADEPSHVSELQPQSLRARVLLADDEPMLRRMLAAMLTSAGCQVQSVSDGEALLDALAAGATPDVIVTDLVMPGLSGTRLVQMLEATVPSCPLVLVTGFTGEDVSTVLSGRSRHRLLRKPFLQRELVAALADVLSAESFEPESRASSA